MRLDFSELREPRAQACFACTVVRRVQETCDAGGLPPYVALANAVLATAVERLPKRARVSPGWFAGQSSALQRLIDVRNRWFDAHHNQPTPGSAALLRSAKAELQLTVREAKSNWILAKCERLSDGVIGGSGSKAAWDVVQEFRRGLQSARQPAPAKMRFADGTMACSAEENANVHAEHYRQLYGHTPTFDATVLSMLRRRPVMPGLDHVPTGRGDYGDFELSFPEAPIRTRHVLGITEHGTGLVWTNPHVYPHLHTTDSQQKSEKSCVFAWT